MQQQQQQQEAAQPGERISLHNFSGCLAEQLVHFHSMRLRDSLFLWVGEGPQLGNLAVAMCTPRVRGTSLFFHNRWKTLMDVSTGPVDSIPASTLLFGDTSDSTSNSLAQRLARKTKKQIFVSYNIQNTDSSFILLIENRIKEEMAAFPEKF